MKRSYSAPGPVNTAMGDCLRAGKTIALASPSPAQNAAKRMSSHASDLCLHGIFFFSSSDTKLSQRVRYIAVSFSVFYTPKSKIKIRLKSSPSSPIFSSHSPSLSFLSFSSLSFSPFSPLLHVSSSPHLPGARHL